MAEKKIPMRRCVGCGESKPKKELIRIVKTPENEFVIDTTGKQNGRGAYIRNNPECLEKSIRNHGLERSFKMTIDKEIYNSIKEQF